MAYRVKYNDLIVYDPVLSNAEDKYRMVSSSAHLAVNAAGTFTFKVPYDNPRLGDMRTMSGVIELLESGVPIYRGRITTPERDFYNTRTIETEGLLACLNDSVIPPFNFPNEWLDDEDYLEAAEDGNVVEFFLSWILDQHNAQVTTEQQIKLGTVTVTDPNNYIARSSESYTNTFELFRTRLPESELGGYFVPRYEDDGTYLDYFAELPLTNVQRVEFSSNLLDFLERRDGTELYTAILPIGKDNLTIEGMEDGELSADLVKEGAVIYSQSGIEDYGARITRIVKWDDVTEDYNLQSKAIAELTGNGLGIPDSISCKAADLHCEDQAIPTWRIGRHVFTTSQIHGVDSSFPLMALDFDILDPGKTVISMGKTRNTYTSMALAKERATTQLIEATKQEIKDYIGQSISQSSTEFAQTASSIVAAALTNYATTGSLEELSAALTLVSNEFSVNISHITEQINNVNGDLQDVVTDLRKYFRFTEDGLLIGEDGNSMILRLDNDIIQFLLDNVPGLTLDNEGLAADNVHISKALMIGDLTAVVQEDGGVIF